MCQFDRCVSRIGGQSRVCTVVQKQPDYWKVITCYCIMKGPKERTKQNTKDVHSCSQHLLRLYIFRRVNVTINNTTIISSQFRFLIITDILATKYALQTNAIYTPRTPTTWIWPYTTTWHLRKLQSLNINCEMRQLAPKSYLTWDYFVTHAVCEELTSMLKLITKITHDSTYMNIIFYKFN